jgi:hypothetical protein
MLKLVIPWFFRAATSAQEDQQHAGADHQERAGDVAEQAGEQCGDPERQDGDPDDDALFGAVPGTAGRSASIAGTGRRTARSGC